MPRVYITKTIGRNIVAGTIRNLPGGTIAKLSAEAGCEDWYQMADPHAAQRAVREAQGQTAVSAPATRGRAKQGVTL